MEIHVMQHLPIPAPDPWAPLLARGLACAAGILRQVREHRRSIADLADLRSMSDRALTDIGLTRSDILFRPYEQPVALGGPSASSRGRHEGRCLDIGGRIRSLAAHARWAFAACLSAVVAQSMERKDRRKPESVRPMIDARTLEDLGFVRSKIRGAVRIAMQGAARRVRYWPIQKTTMPNGYHTAAQTIAHTIAP